MLNYKNIIIIIIAALIAGCSGQSSSIGSSANKNVSTMDGYTSIQLPNGSFVSYATQSVSVIKGQKTSTSLSINAGSPDYKATVSNINLVIGHVTPKSNADSFENVLTTTPNPCVLTSNSESQISCGVNIDATNLAVGTYTIATSIKHGNVKSMLYESLEVIDSPIAPTPGIIKITPSNITLFPGQSQMYTISLNNSEDISDIAVSLSVSQPSLVKLSSNNCTLSTNSNICNILVTAGSQIGSIDLNATAAGYTITPSIIAISDGILLINNGDPITEIYPTNGSYQIVNVINNNSQPLAGVKFSSIQDKVRVDVDGVVNPCEPLIPARSNCNIKVNYANGVANDIDTVVMNATDLSQAITAPVVLKEDIVITNIPRTTPGYYNQVTNGPIYSIFQLHNNNTEQAVDISTIKLTNSTDIIIESRIVPLPALDKKYQNYLQCVTIEAINNISTTTVPAGGDCIIIVRAKKMSSQPGLGTESSTLELAVINGTHKTYNIANTTSLYVGGGIASIGDLAAEIGQGGCGAGNRYLCMLAKYDGTIWTSVADKLNGPVNEISVDHAGNLYLGGLFSSIGDLPPGEDGHGKCGLDGTEPCMLAKYDGNNFTNIANSFGAGIRVIAFDSENNLYTGGQFSTVANLPSGTNVGRCSKDGGAFTSSCMLAKYSNGNWSSVMNDGDGPITAIAVDSSDNLYIGGGFSTVANLQPGTNSGSCGHSNNAPCMLAKYSNNRSWSYLANDADNSIKVITVDKMNNLYSAGVFKTIGALPSQPGKIILAKYSNGLWSTISTANSVILQVVLDNANNNLYVAGMFTSIADLPTSEYRVKLAQYAIANNTWTSLGHADDMVNSIKSDGADNIYAIGTFSSIDGLPFGVGTGECRVNKGPCMLAKKSINGDWVSLANNINGQRSMTDWVSRINIANSIVVTLQ